MKRKQGILLFITSCIPGCGQMHQGYMNRGISLMMAFCAVFFLSMFLRLDYLVIFLIPLWLFSFFDSYNLRSQTDEEASANPDAYLFGFSDVDSRRMSALLQKRHSLIGWGLVLLGASLFYATVADWVIDFLGQFFDIWWLHGILVYDVPRLVVTVGIIALGVWFIRGPRQPKAEEIPTFTPPAAEPVQTEAKGCEAEPEAPVTAEQEDGHGDE